MDIRAVMTPGRPGKERGVSGARLAWPSHMVDRLPPATNTGEPR